MHSGMQRLVFLSHVSFALLLNLNILCVILSCDDMKRQWRRNPRRLLFFFFFFFNDGMRETERQAVFKRVEERERRGEREKTWSHGKERNEREAEKGQRYDM